MKRSMPRREREREIRREAILEAAERAFIECGFDGTTMDAIALEAEFTKRTIYQYFEGKEEILFEIAARQIEQIVLPKPLSTPDSGTGYELIERFVLGWYKRIRGAPKAAALMDQALTLRNQRRDEAGNAASPDRGLGLLESFLSRLMDHFSSVALIGMEDGSLRSDLMVEGAAFAVFFLMKSLLGFVAFGEAGRRTVSKKTGDDLARYALSLVLEGMKGDPQARKPRKRAG